MTDQKQEPMFQIEMWEEKNYKGGITGHCEVRVVAYREIRHLDDAPFTMLYQHEHPHARFALRAYYGDLRVYDGGLWGLEYGYEPEYKLVQPHQLEGVVKSLRKIEKTLNTLKENLGAPQSLGGWIAYLAKATGVKRFCWRLPKTTHPSWRVTTSPEDARYHVDHEMRACVERQKEAQSDVA